MTITLHSVSVESPARVQGQGTLQTEVGLKIYVPSGMITEMCTHKRQLRYMCHKDYCYSKRPTAVASSVARERSRNHIMYGLPYVT